MLDLDGGHKMYYEEHGSPTGKPVVVLHGGPGGGLQRAQLKHFNLSRWRVILFDQRGCGRSSPSGLDSLKQNTTWDLVRDMEVLRSHLGIERWSVFGGSWGSTLALAYAETHPDRTSSLVLRGVCLMQKWERDWLYKEGGVSTVWPEAWAPFDLSAKRKQSKSKQSLTRRYNALLHSKNRKTRRAAAQAWWGMESAISFLKPRPDKTTPKQAEELALLENHYFVHNAWLKPDQLLKDAIRLRKIPITIVQGRYDMVCPLRAAWQLKQRLPHAKLVVIPDAGHAGSEPGTAAALKVATDAFLSLN
jgi:proline iminopeptidase